MSDLFQRALDRLRRLFASEPAAAERPPELVVSMATSGDSDAWIVPSDSGDGAPTRPAAEPPAIPPAIEEEPGRGQFLLTVDDAGQFLVATGSWLSLGHVRAGEADLRFLADVGPIHAVLRRSESLRSGPSWRLAAHGAESVLVEGEAVGPEGCTLHEGDAIRLGDNLHLRFRAPDPASHTVLLELHHGAECCGARTVVLFGEGAGGRLRIGAAGQRHITVPNLDHEIELVRDGERLQVVCEAGVRGGAESWTEGFSLPCPPTRRVDLSIGRSKDGRPPFSLALDPVTGTGEERAR